MTELLSVRDLVVTVDGHTAVDHLSFELAPGRTLGLVGESGSGKSLTALALLRLLPEPEVRIAGGSITFRGQDPAAVRGDRVAMVFQEPSTALNPVMTIGCQVGEPLRVHRRLSRSAAWARAVSLLEEVGIPGDRARAYPHEFSGGMKQRAMIAMALATGPDLLVADEPTTALDVTVQAQILDLLARLCRERHMALLLISHDLTVVAGRCDEVAVMYAGRIVEQAPTATLFAAPRHPYTAALLAARRDMREIPGSVPPLGAMPTGCAFADRCPRLGAGCRDALPPLDPVEPGHLVRCLYP